jgi:hypothetical protein
MARVIVPDPGRVGKKWVQRSGNAAMDYVEGAERTSKDQAGNAVAAKAIWTQQLASKDVQDRWEARLKATGTEGWKRGVREKGGQRYPGGVAAAEGKFTGKIGGVLSAIGAVDLPPRGLPASAGNFQRSQTIGQALAKLRGRF